MSLFLFYALAAIILVAAVLVVTLRNVFHSALMLVLTFFMVAGIYILLHAEFLAVVQVLIYVGAVTVLMLFAIMLTHQLQSRSIRQVNEQAVPAALVAAVFLVLAIFAFNRTFGHIDKPTGNHGSWTATIEVSELPPNDQQYNWTTVLEDKAGKNYVAGGSFFVMPQKPTNNNMTGPVDEIATPAGYILSPNPDFSVNTRAYGPGETVNFKIWSDDVDYNEITDASLVLTGALGGPDTLTRSLTNSNPETIGRLLMSKFVLPFEVVSVLLLVSLIGAIVISRRDA